MNAEKVSNENETTTRSHLNATVDAQVLKQYLYISFPLSKVSSIKSHCLGVCIICVENTGYNSRLTEHSHYHYHHTRCGYHYINTNKLLSAKCVSYR